MCADLWDPDTNPDGYVSLGLAENALMHEELKAFINGRSFVDSKAKALTYGDGPSGSTAIKDSLARFFNDYFHPARPVEPGQLMVTNGVTAAIEHVAWTIANPGEGVLLGRPFYRAFIMDMELRTGAKVVPVSFGDIDPCSRDCVAKYEEALLVSNNNGVQIRAIMICHPHNPLGRCYSKEAIIGLMELCQKYSIHLISDEIYALSVWKITVDNEGSNATPFEYVLNIDTRDHISPDLVHVLWGTSKDFGANGLRLGVIISQSNVRFLEACQAGALFSAASSLAENAVDQILSDRNFLDSYIAENQKRLSQAHAYAVSKLDQYGIEYLSGVTAAFFLWINLGKAAGRSNDTSTVSTDEIYKKLLEKKIYVVTGDAAGSEQPGWFRIVFSQRRQLVDETITSIAKILGLSQQAPA